MGVAYGDRGVDDGGLNAGGLVGCPRTCTWPVPSNAVLCHSDVASPSNASSITTAGGPVNVRGHRTSQDYGWACATGLEGIPCHPLTYALPVVGAGLHFGEEGCPDGGSEGEVRSGRVLGVAYGDAAVDGSRLNASGLLRAAEGLAPLSLRGSLRSLLVLVHGGERRDEGEGPIRVERLSL